MSADEEALELVQCPNCGAEYERGSCCAACGYYAEAGEFVEGEPTTGPRVPHEPVYAIAVEARPLAVHEPAWCPYCVALLDWFPSKDEARAYEASLVNHPFDYCVKRRARLNATQEWRLRREAAKYDSRARAQPAGPRVRPAEVA